MRKRYIIIILIILVTLGIIIFNTYLYHKKDVAGTSHFKEITNPTISKEHCEETVCFTGLKIIENESSNRVVFKGYVENKTTTDLDTYVTFVFDTKHGKISYSMKFEKLKSFEKQYFEYQTTDKRLTDINNYALKVS